MTELMTRNGHGQDVKRLPPRARPVTPRGDVLETPEELLLFLDLPGVKHEDLDVDFERGVLAVTGRRSAAERLGACVLGEYQPGDFSRTFIVGQEVDAAKIWAELKDGVLTVHLPKTAAARPVRVPVQGA
jgi:HSP20 family protein